jgi:hypothetical protein
MIKNQERKMTKKQFHNLSDIIELIFTAAIGGGVVGLSLFNGIKSPELAILGGIAGTAIGGYVGFRNNRKDIH